jgi:hypothetical protein
MDYGEAIEVLERANEKFEFPVNRGVDLQSEHERLSDRERREKAGHRDELPEGHQGLLHVSERGRPHGRPLSPPL